MSDRFFLDTNIFIYSFDKNAPRKAARSTELIRRAIQAGIGMVSYQVVQEFFNIALRRFAESMSIADAEQYLSATFRPLLAIHSSHALYGQALQLGARHKIPWYDSLILAAAIEGKCDILYSEDFQHGQMFGELRIVNPFA
jgi:predicted nucleic acid-binding protein